jgi:hypothetical protein
MPLRLEDIKRYDLPIAFKEKGVVFVRCGPCSSGPLNGTKIPMDGRYYVCAGTIILKNGRILQANFEINTHTFDFLERDTVRVYMDKENAWYSMDEPELYELLEISKEDALPYSWQPDIPLDYHKKGPYPMVWPEK